MSTDTKIRLYGWRIHSRPKGAEPLWERRGKVLPQSAVLKKIKTMEERGDGPKEKG